MLLGMMAIIMISSPRMTWFWIGGEGAAVLDKLPAGVELVEDLDALGKRLAELPA